MDKNEKGFSEFMRGTIDYYIKIIKLLFASLKAYWYLLVLGLLGVAYIWLGQNKNQVVGYEGTAIYSYNYLDKPFFSILFNQLQSDVTNVDIQALTSKLKVKEEVASDIVQLDALNHNGTKIGVGKDDVDGPMYLKVVFKSKDHSKTIEDSMTSYLNNHFFVKEKVTEFFDKTTMKIKFIDRELQMLDSLKTMAFENNSKENAEKVNISELFALSNTKYLEKEELVKMIKKNKAVDLFSGFSLAKRSVAKGLKKKLVFSVLILGFFSFLAFVIYWYKNPKSFEE